MRQVVLASRALAVCLVFALMALQIRGNLGGQRPRFSRSEWVARYVRDIDDGLLPGRPLEAESPLNWDAGSQSNPVTGQAGSPRPSNATEEAPAIEPTQVSEDLLPTDTSAQPATHAEPCIDANPAMPANLAAGWQEDRFLNGGAKCLGFGVSFDSGVTWRDGLLPSLTTASGGPWQRASDPWLAFGPNNRVYFSSLLFNETTPDNEVGVSVSTDGGATWGAPAAAFSASADFCDKNAIAVDTYPSSPFYGQVYVGWDLNLQQGFKQWLMVARSTDEGRTFDRPVRLRKKGQNIGVIPKVGPDGTVYAVWLGDAAASCGLAVYFSRSEDGGATWSPAQAIESICTSPIPNLREGNGLPSFAVDPVTGFLYIAWSDNRWSGAEKATLIRSHNKGKSWSQPLQVGDGPANAPGFTTAVAASSGEVVISYYSLQNDPAGRFLVDEYARVSDDQGKTFGPDIRLTPASFDARLAALAGPSLYFLGDYQGIAAGNGFDVIWVDTANVSSATGRQQPEVFCSPIQ